MGQPFEPNVNGEAKFAAHHAASYQEMLERVERAEAIEGIQRGLADIKTGKSRSLDAFDRHMRRKFKIPSDGE